MRQPWDLRALRSLHKDPLSPLLGLPSSASPNETVKSLVIVGIRDYKAIRQLEEINDLQHVRGDLHFPITMPRFLFMEIMHPKSQEDLEKHLSWRYLVRDIFQLRPLIIEDTNEGLERINLGLGKGEKL